MPAAKSTDIPKSKMATRPAPDKRILSVPSRTGASEAEAEKAPYRPRAKVIVVRYPSTKRVVVATPAGAD